MQGSSMDRRQFLSNGMKFAVSTAALGASARSAPAAGANEKFTVAIVGCGIRGKSMVNEFLVDRKDVEIAYVCDPDSNRMNEVAKLVAEKQTAKVTAVQDFRKILDDKSLDVVFSPTPDHWHALVAILACQAGKDVYTEKPLTHNPWEGQQMIAAARKYNRVVQMGSQNRSGTYIINAIKAVRSGQLGDVHLVKVFNMRKRSSVKRVPDTQVPEGVDYDLWVGPAPFQPFNPNRFHYNWHWRWDFSGGDIINDSVHQIDLARWAVDRDYPKSVYSTGGKHCYVGDDQETPDTQIVTWDFDKLTMIFEMTLWTPYMHKTASAFRESNEYPHWLTNASRVEIYGTKAMMLLGRHGNGWQIMVQDGKILAEENGKQPMQEHYDNFIECVKSRKRPNADVEEGHRSTLLCQLANISYRLGGRKLAFDGKTETIIDDAEAQKLMKRAGREPYTIPETV